MESQKNSYNQGFVTILTGLYAYQDCVHFLASVRKFHDEPILILIDRVPWYLKRILKQFRRVYIQSAPRCQNPVLASRLAKVSLYNRSPFDKTIYLDCDTCLLANISEVFKLLDWVDLALTLDIRAKIKDAINLLRVEQTVDNSCDVVHTLNSMGMAVSATTPQYNGGFLGFRKNEPTKQFFLKFSSFLNVVIENQDICFLRDQGALAAAIEAVNPRVKVLPYQYNFLSKWKNQYPQSTDPVKILHCTYPMRPQYAKNVTRSLSTRIFDKAAQFWLPNQTQNPWRAYKAHH